VGDGAAQWTLARTSVPPWTEVASKASSSGDGERQESSSGDGERQESSSGDGERQESSSGDGERQAARVSHLCGTQCVAGGPAWGGGLMVHPQQPFTLPAAAAAAAVAAAGSVPAH